MPGDTTATNCVSHPAFSDRTVMLLCFDYEGHWGMPHSDPYDLEQATTAILNCLEQHNARGIFFTVGKLAVERPDLVSRVAQAGHEVALHGWLHERIDRLTTCEFRRFEDGLEEAAETIQELTGFRPTGFRAPFLLSPRFFDVRLYRYLRERGFQWVSNREIRRPAEILRPDRFHFDGFPPNLLSRIPRQRLSKALGAAMLVAFNPGLCIRATPSGASPADAMKWLVSGALPYLREGLLEIPLYTPMDCDLLGLPRPSVPVAGSLLEYAYSTLARLTARPQPITMLTFHDWIVTGTGRLALLDRLLKRLTVAGLAPRTARESWATLSSLATTAI